jgi:hypothetical protein
MALQDVAMRAPQGSFSPSQAQELTERYVRETEESIADLSGAGSRQSSGGSMDSAQRLRQYASMWAVVMLSQEFSAHAAQRIAEIDAEDPEMEFRYAEALLYASEGWDNSNPSVSSLQKPGRPSPTSRGSSR